MRWIAAALLTGALLSPVAYSAPLWEGDVCSSKQVEKRNTVPSVVRSPSPSGSGAVAFIGDSLAYGLAQASGAQNGGVVGIGLAGKRLRSMVALNQTTLPADYQRWLSLSQGNAAVIIEIGTNDFGYTKPPESYALLMDRYVLPLHPACLVLPPPTERRDVMRGIERLTPVMRAWSATHGIRTIDFPQFAHSERAADGIHFTHGGYVHLAQDIRHQCSL